MKRLKIELMEKILILDNYDSFTYNIVHLLHELGTEVDIARNDRISVEEAGRDARYAFFAETAGEGGRIARPHPG